MQMNRRNLFLGAIGLTLFLATTSLQAQGGQFFKRYTLPQAVAGGGFGADIVLLNSSSTTCQFGVFAHRGAGELADDVSLGGQPGGFATGSVAPHSGRNISVESPGGQFIGAATVDLLTPECFNAFTVQLQYRLRNSTGTLSELFSYATPLPIKPGQCALAAVNLDTDNSDGDTVVPGFAAVSVSTLQGAQLCHTLKNNQGSAITQEICIPTDGSHQAELLTDIFTQGFESGDVSSWQVCLQAPPTTGSTPRVDPLFIDVVTEGGVTQFDGNEHQVKRPGCQEDQFNVCLDDRFRVSANFKETPSGPTRQAQVAAVTPDQSGYYFFGDDNTVDLVARIIDGCPVNNRFWVFYGSTTNVEYEITVTDTARGTTKTYFNPFGNAAPAVTDTSAFQTCP